jgi:hypothetical protein
MNLASFSLLSLLTLTLIAMADQRIEQNLRRLVLRDNVQLSIGPLNEFTNFSKLADMDEKKVDADLARYKIKRVSDAFISKDGKYVLTFARDAENKTIKRVLFLYDGSQVRGYADDVVDMNTVEIKTTQGSVRVGDGQLLAD